MTAYSLRIVAVPTHADEDTYESGALRAKTAQAWQYSQTVVAPTPLLAGPSHAVTLSIT